MDERFGPIFEDFQGGVNEGFGPEIYRGEGAGLYVTTPS